MIRYWPLFEFFSECLLKYQIFTIIFTLQIDLVQCFEIFNIAATKNEYLYDLQLSGLIHNTLADSTFIPHI